MNNRLTAIAAIILAVALTRLLPHPPNFTPLGAIALFSGAYISRKSLALIFPIMAMLVSDAMMGFKGWAYPEQTIAVYSTYLLITTLGFALRNNKGAFRVAGLSITSSVVFFITTNFFVWMGGFWHQPALYPMNMTGLTECYIAAVPFFDKTIVSDLFFNTVLFGGFYLLQINIPSLAKEKVK